MAPIGTSTFDRLTLDLPANQHGLASMFFPKSMVTTLAWIGLFSALNPLSAADSDFEAAFRTSLIKSFNDASGKLLSLAEAIPEAKYGWRPAEGVSSVVEILVHVTETNLVLGARLGGTPPAGLDRKTVRSRMATKEEALTITKQGMQFIREVLTAVPAAELLPEVTVFGHPAPKMRVAFLPADHAHEHLGQLIAYARMNQIVPPWSK
jgi:uncharacterized damage-inducible protein DinB